ncbi:hypothetical protein JW905_15365, partial [bacterium]|nr:hypothetical protein [candidate division CSSED10-310 bacterium]
AAMVVIPSIWMYRLAAAHPDLWHEWFWDNQVGRFIGSTSHLGHIHGPTYYLPQILVILLPWTPLVIGGFVDFFRNLRARRPMPPIVWVTAAWTMGGLIMLSAAGTKRTIYLFPLLAGFAFMAAWRSRHPGRIETTALTTIGWLFAVVAAVFALIDPILSPAGTTIRFAPDPLLMLFAAVALWLALQRRRDRIMRMTGITACLYVTLMLAAVPYLDVFKNYEPFVMELTGRMTPEVRADTMGWRLDQTTLALLPFYCDWRLENTDSPERIERILKGEDPRYRYVLYQEGKRRLPDSAAGIPYEALLTVESNTSRRLTLVGPRR